LRRYTRKDMKPSRVEIPAIVTMTKRLPRLYLFPRIVEIAKKRGTIEWEGHH